MINTRSLTRSVVTVQSRSNLIIKKLKCAQIVKRGQGELVDAGIKSPTNPRRRSEFWGLRAPSFRVQSLRKRCHCWLPRSVHLCTDKTSDQCRHSAVLRNNSLVMSCSYRQTSSCPFPEWNQQCRLATLNRRSLIGNYAWCKSPARSTQDNAQQLQMRTCRTVHEKLLPLFSFRFDRTGSSRRSQPFYALHQV